MRPNDSKYDEYFDINHEAIQATCRICQKTIRKNCSGMRTHLRSRHQIHLNIEENIFYNEREEYQNFIKSPDQSIITNMNEDKEYDITMQEKYSNLKTVSVLPKQNFGIQRNEKNANFENSRDSTNSSPWIVKSIEEFLYYCCPECNHQDQSKDNFINHVLSFHPNAKKYLETIEILKMEDLSDSVDNEENFEKDCDIEYSVKSENSEQPVKTYTCNFCNKNFSTFKEHWDWHNSGNKHDVKTEPSSEKEDQSNDQYDDSYVQEDSYEVQEEIIHKVSTLYSKQLMQKILKL